MPLAVIRARYQAAVQPADAAISAIVGQALAYHGGSTAGLDSAVPPVVTTLGTSSHALGALTAPAPLNQAIVNVARALTTLAGDLSMLRSARGSGVQAAIAAVVADAGRESAANNVVGLLLTLLTTPTSEVPLSVVPPLPDETTTTPASTTTTSATTTTLATTTTVTTTPRPSTTTVPRTTTTTTSTLPTTSTTTVAPTTTTVKPHATTTNILHLP